MFESKRAERADIGLIRQLALKIFPQTYAHILSPEQSAYMMDMMYSQASLLRQFEQAHAYYIGFFEGEPIGYVSIERQGEKLFHLQKIYVLPSKQGLGLGRKMFEVALTHIRQLQPQGAVVELNVNRSNKALEFYKKMGMHKAREVDFDIGNGFFINDYIMALEVK